jgi:hypothetical protein
LIQAEYKDYSYRHVDHGMANPSPPDDNRFARFTVDDHSAPIWIASILSMAFAYLILAVRLLYVKWNMHGLDDALLTLAHVSSLMKNS